jgi:hypothetical protein
LVTFSMTATVGAAGSRGKRSVGRAHCATRRGAARGGKAAERRPRVLRARARTADVLPGPETAVFDY